jgi:hypothetical protein
MTIKFVSFAELTARYGIVQPTAYAGFIWELRSVRLETPTKPDFNLLRRLRHEHLCKNSALYNRTFILKNQFF